MNTRQQQLKCIQEEAFELFSKKTPFSFNLRSKKRSRKVNYRNQSYQKIPSSSDIVLRGLKILLSADGGESRWIGEPPRWPSHPRLRLMVMTLVIFVTYGTSASIDEGMIAAVVRARLDLG